jgi:hypothetical protein
MNNVAFAVLRIRQTLAIWGDLTLAPRYPECTSGGMGVATCFRVPRPVECHGKFLKHTRLFIILNALQCRVVEAAQ